MTLPRALPEAPETLAFQLTQSGIAFERECCLISGRKFRSDFVIRSHRLAIEIDGGTWTQGRHARGAGILSDCRKQNALVLAGWFPLRFTTEMVLSGEALEVLLAALR